MHTVKMPKTILVVEDDADMRELIRLHLEGAGYAVKCVDNGLEAVRFCVSARPDLIISDVHMPRVDGFEMVKLFKSEDRMKDIPVIYLTVDEAGVGRGKELGAIEYLIKPLRAETLLAAVAKHI